MDRRLFFTHNVAESRRVANVLLIVPIVALTLCLVLGLFGVSLLPDMTDYNGSPSYFYNLFYPVSMLICLVLTMKCKEKYFARITPWTTVAMVLLISIGIIDDQGRGDNTPVYYFLPVLFAAFAFYRMSVFIVVGFASLSSLVVLLINYPVKSALATWVAVTAYSIVLAAVIVGERERSGRYHKKLRQLAQRDPLTGLFNRTVFDDSVRAFQHSSDAPNGAMVIIDVDRFKQVNDHYGHLVGDEVLRAVGLCLQRMAPDPGVVCRLGGDEMAILTKGQSISETERMITDLVAEVSQLAFAQHPNLQVTVSVGAAHLSMFRKDLEQVYSAADQALYAVKAAGRNGAAVAAQSNVGASQRVLPRKLVKE